jgi:Co/Zn/Cd efflux system component
MTVLGVGVVGQAVYRYLTPGMPIAETMGWVAGLALVANLTCAMLLLRHRNDDLNMRSTWLCSRNDVVSNVGVLVAAWAVAVTQSKAPDLIVGIAIAVLVLRSAFVVLTESFAQFRGLTHSPKI